MNQPATPKPLVIGLTGGIGSGKTTVANGFAALGIELVDADQVARALVEPGSAALQQIVAHFGEELLQTDGQLDRAALRARVFSHPAEKDWLNQLLHPLIRTEMQRQLLAARSPYVLFVAPLLLENKLQDRIDRLLVVDIPQPLQLQRTLQRDGGSEQQIAAIMAAQISREQRLAAADDIIDNSAEPEQLSARIAQLHQKYLQLANQRANGKP
ncbi:dephospho-CoA kinase [Alkalimonas amylolytica]|uniref:Dephospho-CoA kinase n=1 Tax=Alkalimonas amylolytica TaxID=152573 RepID=A0A1H4E6R7_ALKAM|nr:dephospho-CoA kinase [Alkalimonas amylolytica]SEA80774.1 dephospho-CoA kinase [Alkalimonas amylolytica]